MDSRSLAYNKVFGNDLLPLKDVSSSIRLLFWHSLAIAWHGSGIGNGTPLLNTPNHVHTSLNENDYHLHEY
jgi:hypothetical protein